MDETARGGGLLRDPWLLALLSGGFALRAFAVAWLDPGMLLLVPRNGVGLTISRLLTRASLSDEKFWGEVRRRAVLCRSCSRRGR